MKLGKKLWSILLTMVMVFAMMVPAMAETTDPTTVTIEGTGNEFSAWQLLTATEGNNNNFAYELNSKYAAAFQTVTGKTTSKDIVAYITGLTDADDVRVFADAMYAAIAKLPADKTTTSKTFNLEQGYYLIAETVKGADPDTVSKVMLDTKGKTQLTVETKEGTVDFEKKVKETNDTTGAISDWQDGADYDIGDVVPFQLKATLPNDFEDYTTYQLTFHDKQSSGLTFNRNSVVVKIGNTEVAEGYSVVEKPGCDNDCTFHIIFNDLTETTAENGSVITVEYTSTLNSGAVIGSAGNPNEAYLEFSNDMYGDGTGETVEDIAVVFTYKFNVNKVHKVGDNYVPLEGAGFTLYKKLSTDNNWHKVGDEITGKTTFEFKGLDAGTYKLVETTVPAGYNKADDIEFTITSNYDIEFESLVTMNPALSVTTNVDSMLSANVGELETNVLNMTGAELPSTGGIGTTIFYAAGGILVVGAAILLIAKKRTENEE